MFENKNSKTLGPLKRRYATLVLWWYLNYHTLKIWWSIRGLNK